MRNNLLANKKTTDLFSITQNKLSTGLKVSTAISNPSAYFTAANLNNRASDLSELLDAMEQGSKTIETSSKTLESGSKILQQMKSIATASLQSTIDKTQITEKWFTDNEINMQHIATDKASLISKLASANSGDTIYLFGNIDMGDDSLTIKNGVKLAGIQTYLEENGYSSDFDASNASSINFDMGTQYKSGVIMGNNSTLENLSVSMKTEYTGDDIATVYVNNKTGVKLHNVSVELTSNRTNNQLNYIGAIANKTNSSLELSGIINIKSKGGSIQGVYHNGYYSHPTLNITADAIVNIETNGASSSALRFGNVFSQGTINIKTKGALSHGIDFVNSGSLKGNINIETTGAFSRGIRGGLDILSGSKVMINSDWTALEASSINVQSGVIIGFKNSTTAYNYKVYNTNSAINITANTDNLDGISAASSSNYNI